jgi:hypothetical protein
MNFKHFTLEMATGVDVREESLVVRTVFVYFILFTDNTMRCPTYKKGQL